MGEIFISYRSLDVAHAGRVAEALRAEGVAAWWAENLGAGSPYALEIETRLRQASAVVVLWTPQSVGSLWVRAEAEAARSLGRLAPVVIEPCNPPVPFNVLHTLDLCGWTGDRNDPRWQRLVAGLRERALGSAPDRAMPAGAQAPSLEQLYWASIKDSADARDFRSYLDRYPDGLFAELARRRAEPAPGTQAVSARSRPHLARWFAAAGLGGIAVAAVLFGMAPPQPNSPAPSSVTSRPVAEPEPMPASESTATASREAPPAAAPPQRPARSLAPELKGLSAAVAEQRLSEARLEPGRRWFNALRDRPAGTVYLQRPAAGTPLDPGTTVDLWFVRARPAGVEHTGLLGLRHTQVLDLDGPGGSRDGVDIRFDAAEAMRRLLEPLGAASMAVAPPGADSPSGCAGAGYRKDPIALQVGSRLCVRTSAGRDALLRVVDLGEELALEFTTASPVAAPGADSASPRAAPSEFTQRLTLLDRESPNLRTGTRSRLSGGDYYVLIDAGRSAAAFWANNEGQRGLVDLGAMPGHALRDIVPPASGYAQHGVPAVEGHVVVARALDAGRFVVMRVLTVTSSAVVVEALYR